MQIDKLFSNGLSIRDHEIVAEKEDRDIRSVIDNRKLEDAVLKIKEFDDSTKKYLALSSLPWAQFDDDIRNIGYIWEPMQCFSCSTMTYRRALPYGNMRPSFIMIMSHCESHNKIGRIMQGNGISYYIRCAMLHSGLYWNSWYTSLVKCGCNGIYDNEDAECSKWLVRELFLLKCKKIIFLGTFSLSLDLSSFNIQSIISPSDAISQSISSKDYGKIIRDASIKI